jgi:hypothetical protein
MTLDRAAEQMADVTGFSRPPIITYILTGKPPALTPFAVSCRAIWHESTGIFRRQPTIACYARDITYSDHRGIFKQIRKALNVTKKKVISEEDQQFQALVRRRGEPPKGRGTKTYWAEFCMEWNSQEGVTKYLDGNGPRVRYQRIMKKLNTYGIDTPTEGQRIS